VPEASENPSEPRREPILDLRPGVSPAYAAGEALMSFGDHLEELRKRIFFGLAGVVPVFVLAFVFGREILDLLVEPAREKLAEGGQPSALLQTAPFETFGTVVQIALIVMIVVGAPWLLYQLWKFVSPGLYAHERRFVHILLPLSGLLAVSGVVFMYLVILPVILQFFIGFGAGVHGPPPRVEEPPAGVVFPSVPVLHADPPSPQIGQEWVNTAINQRRVCIGVDDAGRAIVRGTELITNAGIVQQYRISEYVRTVLNLSLAFALGFQMPCVVLLLGWLGILRVEALSKYRRHAIVANAIAAAVLTPADPLSMILLAIPLCLLYELGGLLLRILPADRVAGGGEPADADA
jgi:Sec-independent protein secretion pathway component TatC